MELMYLYSGTLLLRLVVEMTSPIHSDCLTYGPALCYCPHIHLCHCTAQYNVDYTVSIVATNCAGNSATAEYNFRIGKLLTLYFM